MKEYFYDQNKVRYKLAKQGNGNPYNWLCFPGGPGGDSTYLHTLIDYIDLPGNVWLIDLPGNGSNINNSLTNYDFDQWMEIFIPTISKFENPIIVGHSFGGMLPLFYPELENILKGFVILNSMPKLDMNEAVEYAKQFDLPDLSQDMGAFILNPSQETFDTALAACIPYYFPKETLEKGKALLQNLPFQYRPAVWWQKKAIELNFSAKWIPQNVPTAILGGKYDCICPFSLFKSDSRFNRSNISLYYSEKSGHIGWVESMETYQKAFLELIEKMQSEK